MRAVHLADLHLGFRQFQRLAPGGINQREADVAQTFRQVVDRIVEIAPDLVVVAGDVFHQPRPTNSAILFAFQQFARLVAGLPKTPIIVVAGNHDTPRTVETGGILQLLAPLGVHVADRGAQRFAFPELNLSVLAVPDAGAPRPALEPDRAARFNVMVLHGEVQGMLRGAAHHDRAAIEIPQADLHTPRWDYVALGHYHVYREIAPNTFYSGSIEYTSSNPWGELVEERQTGVAGKGFVERNLITGEQCFHALRPARALVELPSIRASGFSPAELDAAIRAAADGCSEGIEGKIVRLIVHDVSRETSRALDYRAIRELQRRAMSFRLDLRAPTPVRRPIVESAKRPTIEQRLAGLIAARVHTSSDIDRRELMNLAAKYLAEAAECPAASAEEAA